MSKEQEEKIEQLQKNFQIMARIVHNLVVANQAAWLEWKKGRGAEAAMVWVHNGLVGPGHIPSDSDPHVDDPQAFYDANTVDTHDDQVH